jgi:hypothetical protein
LRLWLRISHWFTAVENQNNKKPGAQRQQKKGHTMKNRINPVNRILVAAQWLPALAVSALLTTAVAPALADDEDVYSPGVIPPVVPTHPYGLTYSEWLAKWWQWSLAFPVSADPEYGTADISAKQSGDVWFLPAPLGGGTGTRTGTVPEGTALFVPVLTFEADNTGCPTYTDFTAAQLAALVQGGWSAVTTTSCTIDGVAVAGMDNPTNSVYLVQTQPFSYKLAAYDNVLANYMGFVGETCIPDGTTVSPTVAEGICVMIRPLSVGTHTIHIGAAAPTYGLAYDVTFDITVAPHKKNK